MQIIFNGLISGSAYALIALGFNLIYSTVRFFHFAHGAIYAWGAYFVFLIYILFGWPLWVACFLSVILTSVLGVLINVSIYNPLKLRKASTLVLLLASLGIFIVLQNMISLFFGDDTKIIRSGIVKEGVNIFGAFITPIQIFMIFASVFLFMGIWLFLKRTKLGKAIRAIANDDQLAEIFGLSTTKIVNFVFLSGSGLAAIASILIAFDTDMTPHMGFNALLYGVVAVIIGGLGNILGAYFGGMILGFAQHIGVWKIPSKWQDAIAFCILIIFLFFRPQGLFGKRSLKADI